MQETNSVMGTDRFGAPITIDKYIASTGTAVTCLLASTLMVCACIRSQDRMVILSDQIGEQAVALRSSQASEGIVSQTIQPEATWVLLVIPRKGFDQEQATRIGVGSDVCRQIIERSKAWSGVPLLVYAMPRSTSITRLPEGVDVQEQSVLQGGSGNFSLTFKLSRAGDNVSITSMNAQHQ